MTTRSEENVHKTLELRGLMAYIDTVVSRGDLIREAFKPHPRPILLALERLQVKTSDAITIGDAKEDIESGKRAGTLTIGVSYGSMGKKLKESSPDFVVADIREIIPILT